MVREVDEAFIEEAIERYQRISALRTRFEVELARLEVTVSSPDGLVEVVHMPGRKAFTLGVQWHPEWRASENPNSIRMFKAFGQACRDWAAANRGI